jgi:Tfp pilus assembly protein PilO
MKNYNPSKRSKNDLVVLLMVLVIGILSNSFYFYFSFMSQAAEIQELDRELIILEQSQYQLSMEDVSEQVSEEDIELLLHQLPFSDESPRFLISLKEIEGKSNVIIENYRLPGIDDSWEEFSFSEGTESSIFKKTITLSIEGNYPQLLEFLSEIYHLDRITAIKKWKINPKPYVEDGITEAEYLELLDNPMLEAILELEIYKTQKYESIMNELVPLSVEDPQTPYRKSPITSNRRFFENLIESNILDLEPEELELLLE